MNMVSMLIHPGLAERLGEIWKWANRLAAPFKENGVVLSLLGTIGNELRLISDDPEEGPITPARIEQLFEKSLELEKNGPQTFARAGKFYFEQGDVGQAEKCYARGFKLDRTASNIALELANVYEVTERPRDALNVLDLCMREGTEDTRVAWEAAMTAFNLRQFDQMLNYLNRYEELAGEVSPINYYRSVAFLNQGHLELALDAVQKERKFSTEVNFHCDAVEYCVNRALDGDAGNLLKNCVQVEFDSLSYMPTHEIRYLFELLWLTASDKEPDQDLVVELEERLFAAGFVPDEYFDRLRENQDQESMEEVQLFKLLVEQELDDDWPTSSGCLDDQQHWTRYLCEWGVLATDQEDAEQRVLDAQKRCYPLAATVLESSGEDQVYNDVPGIVWQGPRFSISPELPFDLDELDEFDDDSEEF